MTIGNNRLVSFILLKTEQAFKSHAYEDSGTLVCSVSLVELVNFL